jgi:hypothetical protein
MAIWRSGKNIKDSNKVFSFIKFLHDQKEQIDLTTKMILVILKRKRDNQGTELNPLNSKA